MGMKHTLRALSLLAVIAFSSLSGCVEKGSGKKDLEPLDISNVQNGLTEFSGFYSIDPLTYSANVPPYTVPLAPAGIYNFDDFTSKINLSSEAEDKLMTNGFVVIKNPLYEREEDIQNVYESLKEKDIPLFITTDSLLHLYHIQFDETLRKIEEDEFFADVWDMGVILLEDAVETYKDAPGDLKEAARRNAAYFAVALSLLQPAEDQICVGDEYTCNNWETQFTEEEGNYFTFDLPSFVREDVEKELELIEAHGGFGLSPVFKYSEDYSQYVPRGHYTRSEKLKNYFSAFMWLGRITFLLKDKLIESENPGYDAMIQTMSAALISSTFAVYESVKEKWDRIYSVTSFYVGLADDLLFYEYLEAMNFVFGGEFDPDDLNAETIQALKEKLAEYRTPKIYGGTGACSFDPPFTPEQLDECLENTKGLRFMGQRFVPDSYVFSNLVGMSYTGSGEPFTLVYSAGGPIRGFPRGLDIMAILGSARAMELLETMGDTEYDVPDYSYDDAFTTLVEEFNSFDEAEWNKNLYFSWMNTLRSLLKEAGEGYPTFMQGEAWIDKELVSALASWAELRHDTILYAKQSYTMDASGEFPVPNRVVGYVEPLPEFYNMLLALTRMTSQGLDAMNVLDDTSRYRLTNLQDILSRLRDIAVKELENSELDEQDIDFINHFADVLAGVIADVRRDALKTTLVADVHTDSNTGEVLEEGVGYIKLIIVAYPVADGTISIGAGPVFSYYEFKHPMDSRLTDEAWRDLLESGPPLEPEWIDSFAVTGN